MTDTSAEHKAHTMTPVRIQRKRTKGFRLPENTVCVSRPSKWGNPFIVGVHGDAQKCVDMYRAALRGPDPMLTISTSTDPAHAAYLAAKADLHQFQRAPRDCQL